MIQGNTSLPSTVVVHILPSDDINDVIENVKVIDVTADVDDVNDDTIDSDNVLDSEMKVSSCTDDIGIPSPGVGEIVPVAPAKRRHKRRHRHRKRSSSCRAHGESRSGPERLIERAEKEERRRKQSMAVKLQTEESGQESRISKKSRDSIIPSNAVQGRDLGLLQATPRGSTNKTSVIKMVLVALLMFAGVCGLVATVFVGGTTLTLVGSSAMGLGALLVVVGFCWHLSKSKEFEDRLELRVMDAGQLADLLKQGVPVREIR